MGETIHRYRVVRLWEESTELFLNSPGLLPLASLSKSSDPTIILRKVAQSLKSIADNNVRQNLTAATAVFGGLVVKPDIVKTILRSQFMKESAVYQEILQEGRQEGLQMGKLEGKLETIPLLTKLGLTIAEIAEELDIDIALVNQFIANQNN